MRKKSAADLPVTHTPEWVVITFPAEVDISNGPAIREQLLRLLNAGVPALVLDLSATRFCGSTCVDVIMRTQVRADVLGTLLRVVMAEHGMVRKVCQITGLTQTVTVSDSLRDACTSLTRSAAPPGTESKIHPKV